MSSVILRIVVCISDLRKEGKKRLKPQKIITSRDNQYFNQADSVVHHTTGN